MIKSTHLNIGAFHYPVSTLGPGIRFGIWVQGCPFNCPSCCSPDYIPFKDNRLVSISSMAEKILSNESLEGITLSGGEPFAQAGALSQLLSVVLEARPELNVICFTGFSYNKLRSKEQQMLLANTDLLITELFEQDLNSEYGLRGSDNQEFIFLTDKLKPFEIEIREGRKESEIIVDEKLITQIGIPSGSNKVLFDQISTIINL
jgi:anaerobic ribonucleoside-triphosphate reductase activating protein